MANGQVYTVRLPGVTQAQLVSATTNPGLQIALSAGKSAIIRGWEVSQEASTASTQYVMELLVSTATAPGTLTNSGRPEVVANNQIEASLAAPFTVTDTGFTGALTGTQYRVRRKAFNFLGGEVWVPTPETLFETLAAQWIWVRFPSLPAGTYTLELTLEING